MLRYGRERKCKRRRGKRREKRTAQEGKKEGKGDRESSKKSKERISVNGKEWSEMGKRRSEKGESERAR